MPDEPDSRDPSNTPISELTAPLDDEDDAKERLAAMLREEQERDPSE